MKNSGDRNEKTRSPDVMEDIEIRRAREGHGVGLRRVHAGMAVFYAAALMLNADAIHRGADRLQYGWRRDAALALSAPAAALSRAVRLHHFRQWIEHSLHGPDA